MVALTIPCGCPYLDNVVDGEIGVYGDGKAACYGNGSVNFKEAIEQAFNKCQEENWCIARYKLLKRMEWKDLVTEIIGE